MRQIVLDTETTGLEPGEGHRIIEIGCIELVDRRLTGNHYHCYINPEREVDSGAVAVHGITNEFLADKPLFGDIVDEFLAFVMDDELVIHNAPFDVGFINHELNLIGRAEPIDQRCPVLDTLKMARAKHPGQRNSLDALCKRYGIDNSHRELHGAVLDSEILADVYLMMTGGQTSLMMMDEESGASNQTATSGIKRLPSGRSPLPVLQCSDDELKAHQLRLESIDQASGGKCAWLHN